MRKLNLSTNPFLVTDDEKTAIFSSINPTYVIHKKVFENMLNVVKKYEENKIYIKATEPFVDGSIELGDPVTCQIFNKDHEYRFYGKITDIDIQSTGLVQITLKDAYKYINLRRDKRYLVNCNANVCDAEGNKLEGLVKNVSIRGLALVCSGHMNRNAVVDVKMTSINEQIQNLKLSAKVIRVNPSISYREYGMEIQDMDDANKQILEEFINALEEQEKAAIAKLKGETHRR